ncbi:hypothetical protein CP532_2904 [Ophiocordyceps camponoti-leonardi (nom. inval.)]|nr:hypothetical protein CP532_2904 [Ophiocordyceps camponoti-leonardi (nom. inval.)]
MRWAKIIACATPLWLSWLEPGSAGLSAAIVRRQDGLYVYRADKRSPLEIMTDGGFRPHGHPNWADNPRAFYMWRHYQAGPEGCGAEDIEGEPEGAEWETAYVSVAEDIETAESYPGWLYEIVPTQNILDDELAESEVLALGGVHWSQVRRFRWQYEADAQWQDNPHYDAALWEESPIRGITRDLPDDLWLVTRSSESVWSNPSAREAAMAFMREEGMASQLGEFPPQFRTYPPNEAIPGPREIPEEVEEPDEAEELWQFLGFESEQKYDEAMARAAGRDLCKRDGLPCRGLSLSKAAEDENVLSRLSEEVAAKDFEKLVVRFGVADLAKSRGGLEVGELRARLRGYQALSSSFSVSKSVSSSIRIADLTKNAKNAGKGVLLIAALGIYVKEVIEVFSTETSALDRLAVLTSIFPLVGCGVQAVADGVKGDVDVIGKTLCLVGDVLLFTPLWPLGVLVQLTRMWWELVAKKVIEKIASPELVHQSRLDGWTEFCGGVEKYIRSDAFADNMQRQYMAEMSAVIFKAAEAKGKLVTGTLSLLAANNDTITTTTTTTTTTTKKLERKMMMRKIFVASRRIRDMVCREADETKQRLRDRYKLQVKNWLQGEQAIFDDKFWYSLLQEAVMVTTVPIPAEAGMDVMVYMAQRMEDDIKKMQSNSQPLPIWPQGDQHLNTIVNEQFDRFQPPSPCRNVEG